MTNSQENIRYCAELIRDQDMERYYTSLFVPKAVQPHYWAVLAFNAEISKINSQVSEPMLGEIRLQWWREALAAIAEGAIRPDPVGVLLASFDGFNRIKPFLLEIIDAWSTQIEGGASTLDSMEDHALHTGGALNAALCHILAPDPAAADIAAARRTGKVWSMLGTVRGLPHELQQNQADGPTMDQLKPTLERMTKELECNLVDLAAWRVPKALKPVFAINALSRRYADALRRADFDALLAEKYLPGNLRKLALVARHHLFN